MADKSSNPGNFANNRDRAAEAGRKGGRASGGNFANNPTRASEAGRKGGQNSHGTRRPEAATDVEAT
ncbi:general stress protein [Pseudomonas oryzihabitans]|jgi:general stress protein YciG|uniref:General stress protein n=1 Tax=Pseudomonas oryzihabitans TaxID=47885 RepID=A0A2Z5A9T1_9PSED|nr:general stress protein [Pseudomonas oryzihabitans]AXA67585.1 general stress protein [Pseudomonas oryzihabitans]